MLVMLKINFVCSFINYAVRVHASRISIQISAPLEEPGWKEWSERTSGYPASFDLYELNLINFTSLISYDYQEVSAAPAYREQRYIWII